jgi:hypothetical protein
MNDGPHDLGNEFAQVRVWIDRSGHDPRLVIEDRATGQVRALDPIMLAQLARIPDAVFDRLMDPARITE